MPIKANDAYAGVHEPTPGHSFTVAYCDRADNARLNHGLPPGHHDYRRFGWYWWASNKRPSMFDRVRSRSLHHGPFTSSRLAYQDAIARRQRAAA